MLETPEGHFYHFIIGNLNEGTRLIAVPNGNNELIIGQSAALLPKFIKIW